jgi:hypothetical protein
MTSTLNLEGEQVRVRLENGAMMRGDVQEVNANSVKVKGRWFPITAVQTEDEVEQQIKANVNTDRRLRRAEQEAKEAAERIIKEAKNSGTPVFAARASGEYSDFVYMLGSDYTLRAQVQDEEFYDVVNSEYSSWSGKVLSDDCVPPFQPKTWGRQWQLQFEFSDNMQYPFPIVVGGTGGSMTLGEPCGILTGTAVRVNCESIIEQAIRAGLEAR